MFDYLRSSWSKIKKKLNKYLPFVLCFSIFCFNPISVYAANWDSWKSFVMDPNVTNGQYWMEGTSSTNGNITISLEVIVSDHSVRFLGDVNSTGYNAGLFIINLPIRSGDVISFNVNSNEIYTRSRYGIKSNLDSSGLYTYNTNVNSDYVLYSEYIEGVISEQTITFVSDYDGYLFFYSRLQAQAAVNTLFSDISINGGVVNLTPEEILNNGNSDTAGIVENFNQNLDEFNSVVNQFDSIENGFINDFTTSNDEIKSTLSDYQFSGNLLTCANWVTDRYMDFFDNSGDFKQYFIYPLIMGIVLFFIGRGQVILGNAYRKPYESTTVTYSDSSGYKLNKNGAWTPTGSKGSTTTTTYRNGGKLRK